MDYNVNKFCNALDELCITYTEEKITQFTTYYEMMIEKNRVMNLTGITDWEEVVLKHFIDSLSIVKVLNLSSVENMIDVGTGAGFPAIPIKIMFPHIKISLLDSLAKRMKFLDEVIQNLQLKDIKTYHGRAEDYGRNKEHREKYELCVSRAVANLSSLSEYCLPFVKTGGSFVSYKSGDCEAEIEESERAIAKLSGKISGVENFFLPESDISRCLISIRKEKSISNAYPRKSGVPSRKPL